VVRVTVPPKAPAPLAVPPLPRIHRQRQIYEDMRAQTAAAEGAPVVVVVVNDVSTIYISQTKEHVASRRTGIHNKGRWNINYHSDVKDDTTLHMIAVVPARITNEAFARYERTGMRQCIFKFFDGVHCIEELDTPLRAATMTVI
jgi:hypothetical protein